MASNCSTVGAPPLRFGAFEVYLVAKLPKVLEGARGVSKPGEVSYHVELLFSKLYSRCWPKVANVIKRIRQHPGVMMEMVRREDAFLFAQAQRDGEAAGLRAALEQMQEPLTSVMHEFGSLRSNATIDAASKLLATLDAGDAELRKAMAPQASLQALEEALSRYGREGVGASKSIVRAARKRRADLMIDDAYDAQEAPLRRTSSHSAVAQQEARQAEPPPSGAEGSDADDKAEAEAADAGTSEDADADEEAAKLAAEQAALAEQDDEDY